MVHPDQVRAAITQALPDARVEVEDLTGGGDHLQVTVVARAFDGLSRDGGRGEYDGDEEAGKRREVHGRCP